MVKMNKKYHAVLENEEVYANSDDYFRIKIETNSLDVLNNIQSAIDNLMTPKKEEKQEDPSCGYCKHFQLDGMFGIWCDKDRNWQDIDAEHCPDYEK